MCIIAQRKQFDVVYLVAAAAAAAKMLQSCPTLCDLIDGSPPGILLSHKKITPFTATWMDPEIIIQSEVRQRRTNIIRYHLYVESEKMVQVNLCIKQTQDHRCRK